ncbi:MAG: YchJ family protein [Treponema sp.]|nr:YchJ family protein [Treponema sp.]
MKPCPCNSSFAYGECCEPYITGARNAPTAEALMRSRYTAYVEQAIDYIIDTCIHDDDDKIDFKQTKNWSEKSKWLGLTILSTEKGGPDDTEGSVEFEASYEMEGLKDTHHENARFKKKDGRWLYDEGTVVPKTMIRTGPKVGRNEPCPCGSGKKYKHCCGK